MAKQERFLNPTLRWYLVGMILANTASEMLFTLLAVYLVELGAGVGQVGLTFSIAAVVPLALQIVGGWLGDTIGRLRTIAIGAVAASVGYILVPLAPTWQWVLPAIMLEYVSGALVGPSFSAFIAEQSSEANRGRIFGITKSIFLTVTIIGPLLGGFLANRYGFRTMLWVAAVLYVSAAVIRVWMATAVRFGAATKAEKPSLASLRASLATMFGMLAAGGIVTWILLTDGVRDVAYALSWDLQPLYVSQVGRLDVQVVGTLSGIRGVGLVVASLIAGWLSDRFGERRVIAAGFALQFVALLIFVRWSSFAGFAASYAVIGLGIGTLIPAYDSLISKAVPEKMRGITFGVFGTSIGLISLPAPWLGARLWEGVSPQLPFIITAVAQLLCVVPVLAKFRLSRSAAVDATSTEPEAPHA